MAPFAGEKPNMDRVGLSYMILGEARQGHTSGSSIHNEEGSERHANERYERRPA
jgi:hypothetical protein